MHGEENWIVLKTEKKILENYVLLNYNFSTFQDSNYLEIKRRVSMSIEKMKETPYQKIVSVWNICILWINNMSKIHSALNLEEITQW